MDRGFNVRVYGICINTKDEILLVSESYLGRSFTKFPGGGLENGEGLLDCLRREFKEELNWEINDFEHFYTTENYVPSAFNSKEQIISIYYRVFLFEKEMPAQFFWKSLSELRTEDVHLPIDKIVAEKLIKAN